MVIFVSSVFLGGTYCVDPTPLRSMCADGVSRLLLLLLLFLLTVVAEDLLFCEINNYKKLLINMPSYNFFGDSLGNITHGTPHCIIFVVYLLWFTSYM